MKKGGGKGGGGKLPEDWAPAAVLFVVAVEVLVAVVVELV